jgi:hypothetical protein
MRQPIGPVHIAAALQLAQIVIERVAGVFVIVDQMELEADRLSEPYRRHVGATQVPKRMDRVRPVVRNVADAIFRRRLTDFILVDRASESLPTMALPNRQVCVGIARLQRRLFLAQNFGRRFSFRRIAHASAKGIPGFLAHSTTRNSFLRISKSCIFRAVVFKIRTC